MAKTSRQHKPAPPASFDSKEKQKLESRKEDSRLIQEALAGSSNAYKALMKKYHDAIFNFIYRMVREKHQVEDLTQEAFIKAFHSLESFNDEFAFSTWLYKIATNNTIDFIRKRKLLTYSIDKPIASKDSEFTFELRDEEYETDAGLIRQQRVEMLEEAIHQLPAKYRKVIHLRHVEDRSYEEIAKRLKLPIGTVKAHIFRAREMLNKQLRKKIRYY